MILIEQSNAQKPRYEVRNMEDVEMVRAIDSQLVIDFGFKIATNWLGSYLVVKPPVFEFVKLGFS